MRSPTHKTLEAITMSEDEDVLTESPTQEEPQKEPTKLDQFIEQLSAYPDVQTAKTHLSEIAEKLHCARSLGYKALKKIDHFKPQDSIETRAKEASVKIAHPLEQPLEQQEEQISEELPPEPETAAPPVAIGFKDKDVTWMFDKGFKMLADVTGYADWKLDPDDSKRLGEIWTPIINQYLPDILPYAPIAIAAITTIVIVVPKVKGWWTYRQKKTKEKPKEPPKEEVKEEPKPEPPKTETPPPLEKDVSATERPMTAPFLEKL